MVQYRAINTRAHTHSCTVCAIRIAPWCTWQYKKRKRRRSSKVILQTASEPLSSSRLFQHSQRSPCLKSMHIASVDQKQYEPLSAALRLSSTLLSSFHFSVYSPTASRQPCRLSPVACRHRTALRVHRLPHMNYYEQRQPAYEHIH